VAQAPANVTTSYSMQKGESVQWLVDTDQASGSVFQSDKPIALVTGSAYLCITSKTSSGGGCDSTHQQIPPVSALGSDYAIAPFATRRADLEEESIPYRLVGAVDGTTLTYDPPQPGAPATVGSGQLVTFEAVGALRVRSQDKSHPFFVSQSMPGAIVTSGSRPGWTFNLEPATTNLLGDEDWVVLLAPPEWQSKYVFFTDPTYGTTNIVVTRLREKDGFHDVNVDCLGVLSGWAPVGSSGDFEHTNVDMLRGGTGPCKNGQHTAKSDGRFGLVVWGLDTYSSYGYPAGGSVAPINDVVVPPVPR
jgi:hypothetical protein